MDLKKVLCALIVLCAVPIFVISATPVRAAENTEGDETRVSAQFFPYGPYGLYGSPYVSPYPYGLQYPPYAAFGGLYPYGGIFPYGLGMSPFGVQNIYYPLPLQGTGFVFQFPYVQIAPYLGASTFWQNQFPNADWSNILAAQFLGLIDLQGLPYLF